MHQVLKNAAFGISALALIACSDGINVKYDADIEAGPLSITASNIPDAVFDAVMVDHWAYTMEQNPVFATSLGEREYDDQLSDPSLAAYEASIEKTKGFVARLEDIDASKLSDDNALNYKLLMLDFKNDIEASAFGGKYMIITNRGGPHMSMTGLPDRLPFFTKADYQSYIARLGKIDGYMSAATDRLRTGLGAGSGAALCTDEGL